MSKKLLLVAVVFAVSAISSVQESQASDFVNGYIRSNGTYVAPHFRSHADGIFSNNYSSYPNINPYTGSIGTHHSPSYSSGLYNYGYNYNYSPSYSTFGSHRSSRWGW